MTSVHHWMRQHGLTRMSYGRMFGGVAAGLGRRAGIAPWPARLLFVLALLVIPGSQLLLYPLLWVLMPLDATEAAHPGGTPAGTPPAW